MDSSRIFTVQEPRYTILAFLAAALVLAMSTWFSASAVVPQLRDVWALSPNSAAWLTISGTCAVLIGLLLQSNLYLVLLIGFIWGITVVADSAQFSTMVTKTADQSYVGTALTIKLASGFAITVVTIWLIPLLEVWLSWRWAFAFLAPGPLIGIWAMWRLKNSPDVVKIGGGKG